MKCKVSRAGIGVIVFVVAVCGAMPGGTAAQGPPSPVILFEDDFATYSRRWYESESRKATALYNEETFTISIVSPGVSLWSVPDFSMSLRDYRLVVSAAVQNGAGDAQFGLIFGGDDDHFYTWVITLDGEWRFLRHEAGTWHDLTPPEARLPDAIVAEFNSEAVRLQMDVTGDRTAALVLNDHPLDTITLDRALTGSEFGLIARAERGFIEVIFDDVLVTTRVEENE